MHLCVSMFINLLIPSLVATMMSDLSTRSAVIETPASEVHNTGDTYGVFVTKYYINGI